MRDVYRTYENHPAVLFRTMHLGWIQNVVIMEVVLTMELREWYIKAAKQLAWIKAELMTSLNENAHENVALLIEERLLFVLLLIAQ